MGERITFGGVGIPTPWRICVSGRRFPVGEVWNVECTDWIGEIFTRGIISKSTEKILRISVGSGGYVTGGFARNLARCILSDRNLLPPPPLEWGRDRNEGWNKLKRYANTQKVPWRNSNEVSDRTWKSGVGDIDIFFPTEVDAQGICSQVNSSSTCEWSSPTLAGYGMEYLSGGNLIQILTKFHGTPDEITGSFDLANAKVYLDGAGLHWSDGWCELEEENLLGIDHFDKPNLLWRVNKWYHRNCYTDFRPGDHAKFVDSILSTVTLAKKGDLKRFGRDVDPASVKGYAKRYWGILPAGELLKISMCYDSYDQMHAIKELSHRGNTTDTFTL